MAETEKTPMLEKTPMVGKTYFRAGVSEDSQSLKPKLSKRTTLCRILVPIVVITILAIIIVAVVLAVVLTRKSDDSSTQESLVDYISSEELMEALKELQSTSINDSRSVLTGFNDSAEYVFNQLEENGYEPYRQYFTVPVFENLRPGGALFKVIIDNSEFTYAEEYQYNVMTYSGTCPYCQGELLDLSNGGSNYGCDSDLPDANNKIILMAYNDSKGCSLYTKAFNAKENNAIAVVFGRDEGDTAGPPASRVYEKTSSGEIDTVDIPAIGVTAAVAASLSSYPSGTFIGLSTYTTVTLAVTYNVLARTTSGTNESVIVVGSHLDSVPPGPGINDNGSGSMANLRLAISLGKLNKQPKNQVLFAWWGAEELGLLGSTYFVAQLSEIEKSGIALNLNFDMIASPNYIRGIYNGSSTEEEILAASTTIQDLFIQYFDDNNLAYEIVPFTGRSDYGPFIEVDIPAGGLFTGAGLLKTQQQFEDFGGIINAPLDPCYHQFCDTIQNIAPDVYQDMTRAAAYVIETLFEQDDLRDYLENGI